MTLIISPGRRHATQWQSDLKGRGGKQKYFAPREKLPSMYVSMILKLTGPFTLSLLRILRWRTRDCPSIYCLQDSNNLQMFAPRVKISSDAPATQGIAMKCFGFQMSRKWLTSRHMIQSQKNDSPETKIIVGRNSSHYYDYGRKKMILKKNIVFVYCFIIHITTRLKKNGCSPRSPCNV